MFRLKRIGRTVSMGLVTLALVACGDILTVQDPQQYTAGDLDAALPAIGNGVEGAMQEVVDSYVIYQSLLSDVYQHTGTWIGYDEVDHGIFQYATSSMDNTMNAWLRARWFAGDAEERFLRVLEGAAATDPLMAQVQVSAGLIDLYMGMAYCEAPEFSGVDANGDDSQAVPYTTILTNAEAKLTRAMATAAASGTSTTYGRAAQAGRARARLLLGNMPGAAADAGALPAGWSYDAEFNNTSRNSVVQLTTATFNQAAGLMYKWWDLMDTTSVGIGLMRDTYNPTEADSRKEVFADGELATDNETPHYSQWKYKLEADDIPMLHSDGMRLIEAEVMGLGAAPDLAGATAMLNTLRAAAGLSPLPNATDATMMRDYILNERAAELFMEGMRMVDLRRFGMLAPTFAAFDQIGNDYDGDGLPGDIERPSAGRPLFFTMTDTEAVSNDQISNSLADRCLPKS